MKLVCWHCHCSYFEPLMELRKSQCVVLTALEDPSLDSSGCFVVDAARHIGPLECIA